MKVKIDNPAFPKGYELSIDGLGLFENGVERELSDEEVRAFEDARGAKVSEVLAAHPHATVDGKGPAKDKPSTQETTGEEVKE